MFYPGTARTRGGTFCLSDGAGGVPVSLRETLTSLRPHLDGDSSIPAPLDGALSIRSGATEDVTTGLFHCPSCETVYVDTDKQTCSQCETAVERVPSTLHEGESDRDAD
jgi:hypothetical protein